MKRILTLMCAAAVFAGCDDDPSGPGGPGLDFVLTAPDAVDSKARVEITVLITRAEGVEYPLTVTFEKANAGEAFIQEGLFILPTPNDVRAMISPALRQDPRIRATVTESSPQAISVSKTVFIDVTDFP